MNDDLPEGWDIIALGDGLLTDIQPGFACGRHNRSGQGIAHLRPMNVTLGGHIDLTDVRYISKSEINGTDRFIRKGDVVFNNTNSPELVGKTAFYNSDQPVAFSNHMTRLRCRGDVLDPEFCAFALYQKWKEGYFKAVCNNHVSQSSISRQVLKETNIPVPPLSEQRRIIATLKALLPKTGHVRERLHNVEAILKRFRQAVLAAACSGKLLHHEDEGVVRLGDLDVQIQTGPFGSSLHRSDYTRGGIPVVNPMHIVNGRICPTDEMTVSRATRERLKSYVLKAGDVIVARRGEMGRCAVIDYQAEGYLCGTGSLFIRANHDVIDPNFLQIVMSSPTTVRFLSERSVGTTMSNLNQDILLDVEFFLPSLAEQNAAVSRVKELFALSDQIEARCDQTRAHADNLTQSILAKAFRGDLLAMHNRCRVG